LTIADLRLKGAAFGSAIENWKLEIGNRSVMAWIVKNSAGMKVERREQPYLTDAMKSELEGKVLPRYPTRQAATLPALQMIQHEYGWVPHQAVEEAAAFLELPTATVLDTASFYEEIWLKPKGKYLIMICRSLSCELLGQRDLLAAVKETLDIDEGQTTPDGKFTLMTAECLGSCGTAPAAMVNETLHEGLTPQNLQRVLEELE
jgi:NADH-quinone oxidoreductase E subunit